MKILTWIDHLIFGCPEDKVKLLDESLGLVRKREECGRVCKD